MALNLGPHTDRINEITAAAAELPEGTRQRMVEADHARVRACRENPRMEELATGMARLSWPALDRLGPEGEVEFWDTYGATHLHEAVLGLLIHDTAPAWAYDYATAVWRVHVGPVMPGDAPWPATRFLTLPESYAAPVGA